ncbi:MAG: hypothetical protein KGL39_13960 [Patescibacteria group bacterium]|nr:hypothetical protein [Patescibacteria group bacterium]
MSELFNQFFDAAFPGDPSEWQAAQQADEEQRRRAVAEAWQRIKRGEYTESDLQTIETELRTIL